jgi:predicted TIM-barrel fold metal-dependent hydrolase
MVRALTGGGEEHHGIRDRSSRSRRFCGWVRLEVYWDTASAFSDPVLHMLRSVMGLANVVFGTDYPYPRDAISIGGLRQLRNTAELDDDERRAVLGGSAVRLIPRLARVETPV